MLYNEDLLQREMKLSEQRTPDPTSMSISFTFIITDR